MRSSLTGVAKQASYRAVDEVMYLVDCERLAEKQGVSIKKLLKTAVKSRLFLPSSVIPFLNTAV